MNRYKKTYTIDFTDVEYYLEMHKVIQKSLDFPDYYGCNWSAFWDSLIEMYGEPISIEIIGLDVIGRKFEDAASKMIEILKRFKHYEPSFTNDIEIALIIGNTRMSINQQKNSLPNDQQRVFVIMSISLLLTT